MRSPSLQRLVCGLTFLLAVVYRRCKPNHKAQQAQYHRKRFSRIVFSQPPVSIPRPLFHTFLSSCLAFSVTVLFRFIFLPYKPKAACRAYYVVINICRRNAVQIAQSVRPIRHAHKPQCFAAFPHRVQRLSAQADIFKEARPRHFLKIVSVNVKKHFLFVLVHRLVTVGANDIDRFRRSHALTANRANVFAR